MPQSRFVDRAAYDVITLANGDTVQVRQALTAAEDALLRRNMARWEFVDGQVRLADSEWWRQHIEICKAFILDWSFTDDDGARVPYQPDLVEQLDEATVTEIAQAIDTLQQRRSEEWKKKVTRP